LTSDMKHLKWMMEPNMETILISLCIAICGGIIGFIFGYRSGSSDMDRNYKEAYNIKDY
jgi:ABC-type cobalt transport system substrate-binding protein